MVIEDIGSDEFFGYAVLRQERRLYAVVSADHHLASEAIISPAELTGIPLIMPDPNDNAGAYERILGALTGAGYEPTTVRVNRSLAEALQDVALGLG